MEFLKLIYYSTVTKKCQCQKIILGAIISEVIFHRFILNVCYQTRFLKHFSLTERHFIYQEWDRFLIKPYDKTLRKNTVQRFLQNHSNVFFKIHLVQDIAVHFLSSQLMKYIFSRIHFECTLLISQVLNCLRHLIISAVIKKYSSEVSPKSQRCIFQDSFWASNLCKFFIQPTNEVFF